MLSYKTFPCCNPFLTVVLDIPQFFVELFVENLQAI